MRLVAVAVPSAGCASRASKAWLFLLRWLCQEAQPDVVALIEALDGDTWAVWVVGSQAMGRPLAGFHPVTAGEQHVQIQGEARDDHGAILCPAHELYGGGGDQEFAGIILRQVAIAQGPHRAVRLDALADDLDQVHHPGRCPLRHGSLLSRQGGYHAVCHLSTFSGRCIRLGGDMPSTAQMPMASRDLPTQLIRYRQV